jgi:hypothetical protein
MMAEVEDLVDDHLRHMRGQLDRMEHRLEDITARLGDVQRSVADHSVKLAEINIKPDRTSPASKSGLLSSRAPQCH